MKEKRVVIENGNIDNALQVIKDYFRRYHPAGYNTKAELSFGIEGFIVRFTRYKSCD